MDFSGAMKRASKFASDNSPTILTAAAVFGTVATAYLTGKASFKAAQIIQDENSDRSMNSSRSPVWVDTREAVHLVWREFIPPAAIATLTIAAIVSANRIGTNRAAALAAAYAISDRAYEEYKTKVIEKVGEKKERGFRDEIAQERVTRMNPQIDVDILGDGVSVLCCDLFTGRTFISDIETLRRAENDINYRVTHDSFASLSDFYDLIGLARTTMSDDFGWNVDKLLELHFSTALTPLGKPCVTFDFRVAPIRGFSRLQ